MKQLVKRLLPIALTVLSTICIYQLFTLKTTKTTSVGTYTCNGGIIKICSSSKEVADIYGE